MQHMVTTFLMYLISSHENKKTLSSFYHKEIFLVENDRNYDRIYFLSNIFF